MSKSERETRFGTGLHGRMEIRTDELTAIRHEIRNHASNAWATERGYEPIYSASPRSRIVVVGQAPGRHAQDSQIPWNDASGLGLRQWMCVTDAQFYDPDTIALLPMDFYYPGKGTHGDRPPRKAFACGTRGSSR